MAALAEGLNSNLGGRPASEFPGSTFPSAFADGIASYARGEGVMKLYFYRTDPNMFGRGGYVYNPFAQIIMPNEGFVRAVVLLQRALNSLIQAGQVTQEEINQINQKLDEINPTAPPTAPTNG